MEQTRSESIKDYTFLGEKIIESECTDHGCSTCKYADNKITQEPCLFCDICLGNDKWEAKNG